MKRTLHCALIFLVLVTSGCDSLFGSGNNPPSQNSNSQPTSQTKNDIQFGKVLTHVEKALSGWESAETAQSATIQPVKDEIKNAIRELGTEGNIRNRCTNCSAETTAEAIEVLELLKRISTRLGDDLKKSVAELSANDKEQLPLDLNQAVERLNTLSLPATLTPPPTPSPTQVPVTGHSDDDDAWWQNILTLALQVVGGLLVLALVATIFAYMWRRAWKTVEFNVGRLVTGHVAATHEPQPDYAPKLSSLSSSQTEMSNRLTELDAEVRALARLVRESLAVTRRSDRSPSYDGFSYQSAIDISPKEEPDFPVSAVDYLGKMNRFANVVRPDFQNGILVNDPDGDGELVLIRDSRDETQPLFVVPRATQFQTKQDFYTYYQKYYECDRPMAGDVWIVGPAVVEKVAGGWQLREKGMLEIR